MMTVNGVKRLGFTEVNIIHPKGHINACTKFHSNSLNNWRWRKSQEESLGFILSEPVCAKCSTNPSGQMYRIDAGGTTGTVRGPPVCHLAPSSGINGSLKKIDDNPPKGNEIFQSGGRTDRVTHLPRPQSACISANAQFKRKFPRDVTTISTNLIIQRIERGDFFQTA